MVPEVGDELWVILNCDFLTMWRKTACVGFSLGLLVEKAEGRQLHLEKKRIDLICNAEVQPAFALVGTYHML